MLVEEPTREEIERTVCSRLAGSDLYEAAWIGDRPVPTGDVSPHAWEGIDEATAHEMAAGDPPNGVEPSEADEGLAARAIETGELRVVHEADAPGASTRDPMQAAGLESLLFVPIPYVDTRYGVLAVGADRPGAFDEHQRTILSEFATTLGFAFAAAERKQALATNETVHLEVRVRDRDHFFIGVTDDTDATLTLDGLVPRGGGSLLVYVTAEGTPAERVLERSRASPDIEQARLVEDRGGTARLELVYVRPTMVETFAEYSARVTDAEASDGEATLQVEVPQSVDVRSVLEAFRARFPDSEVVAKRSVEAGGLSESRFQSLLGDRLTTKQRTTLQAAYYAGYFDRPRRSSGEEVAERLGISPSTFHQHIRVAQRKLTETFVRQ